MNREDIERKLEDDGPVVELTGEDRLRQRRLEALLAKALPPADPVLQAQIMEQVQRTAARRRVVAFLPVAASVAVAILGTLLLGGLPAASTLATLHSWSGLGWTGLAQGLTDGVVALHAAASVLAESLGTRSLVVAAVLFSAGAAGVAAISRRWWRRLVCVRSS